MYSWLYSWAPHVTASLRMLGMCVNQKEGDEDRHSKSCAANENATAFLRSHCVSKKFRTSHNTLPPIQQFHALGSTFWHGGLECAMLVMFGCGAASRVYELLFKVKHMAASSKPDLLCKRQAVSDPQRRNIPTEAQQVTAMPTEMALPRHRLNHSSLAM